jgi:ribonuclease HI
MSKILPIIKNKNNNINSIKIFPEVSCFKLQFDGCSKGNPGLAGAGAVIYYNEGEVWSSDFFVGINATNNQAEYAGLILGLKRAIEMEIKSLVVEGDSLLVINQMKGIYKCNSQNLFELYDEATKLTQNFDNIYFNHILRNYNKRADQLSNNAVDKYNFNLNKNINLTLPINLL